MKFIPCITGLGYGLGALLSTSVFAENTPTDSLNLAPVIVTGQKITRTRMETVSSVEVLDSARLEDSARAEDLYDIVEMAPNVSNTGGFNSLSIRGISNTGPTQVINGASTIGIFVDNGLQTARGVQDNALSAWDLDRVEILRGPQSTTGGRNSLAGQIIMHTKAPEFESNGAARLAFGQHGELQTSIAQTGGLSDNLAYRIAADYQRTDGFVVNPILNDDDFNRSSTKNLRVKFLYEFENGGEALLSLGHNQFNEHGDDNVDSSKSGRISRMNYPSEWETRGNTVSLSIKQPVSDQIEFESNTGYVTSDFWRKSDADGTRNPSSVSIGGLMIPTDQGLLEQQTDEYNFNQEFLLRYNTDKIRSVAGIYFARGKFSDHYVSSSFYIPYGGIPLLLKDTTSSDEEFKSSAVFADIDYKLTPKLTLLAGLRLNKETRESGLKSAKAREISYGPGLNNFIDSQLPSGISSSSKTSTVLLPKLGFNYMWSDNLSTGFVVQKGYRPGGVAVNPIQGTAKEYEEETTINYEMSLRAAISEQLSLNANLFYTDWKDQQVAVPGTSGLPLDYLVENAGESHLYGFEISADYAATSNLNLYAGLGYSKTEFDKFTANGKDYSGQEYQFSRNWTANIAGTYRFNEGWFAHSSIAYASEGAAATGRPKTELDPYTLVNVKLGYEDNDWGVYIYANNLFDKEYRLRRYVNTDYGNIVYGDPRVVGVVANYKW